MRRRTCGAAAAFALAMLTATMGQGAPAPAANAALDLRLPPVERYSLPNGLDVILHEDHKTPIVSVDIWYLVGSKDEAPGRSGFAHLFEHMMFQGSRHVGEDLFFHYLEKAGSAENNGSTSEDRTNYYEVLPSNQLELALWLESDRMAFLLDHVSEKSFDEQRAVVKNEIRQKIDDAPYGNVYRLRQALLFPAGHPYHTTPAGSPADLDAASLEDVKAFFRTFYVPNNASLVIAGDIDVAKTKALVEKYFGPIVRGGPPPTKDTPAPVARTTEAHLEMEADVELPLLIVSWVTPPALQDGDQALDLVSHVLASGRSSRLEKRLVHELQTAQDVSATQSSKKLASSFDVTITLQKGKSEGDVLREIDEVLARLAKDGPTKDELEGARAAAVASNVFDIEGIQGRAEDMQYLRMHLGDPSAFQKRIAKYTSLGADDVKLAARKWLTKESRLVTMVHPKAGAPRSGRRVGGGPP